jgi:hypothetical protein
MGPLSQAVALVVVLGAAGVARADPLDFQLHKLGMPADASSDEDPANASFRTFVNQLGCALGSFNLTPPETLGHSAFNFSMEYAVAKVDSSREVWPRAGRAEDETVPPPVDALLMPSVHIRKGLPFSLELGTRISYLQYSRMTAATMEFKWALNEGFFYLPDLGVRGSATRLMGARDFALTTAGLDIGLGKQLAVGGMLTLTPYAGWNMIYVNASSGVIDFSPRRTLENAQLKPTEDTGVFKPVNMPQNRNNRFYFGLRFISYVFEMAAEVSVTKSFGGRSLNTFSGKIGLDF